MWEGCGKAVRGDEVGWPWCLGAGAEKVRCELTVQESIYVYTSGPGPQVGFASTKFSGDNLPLGGGVMARASHVWSMITMGITTMVDDFSPVKALLPINKVVMRRTLTSPLPKKPTPITLLGQQPSFLR